MFLSELPVGFFDLLFVAVLTTGVVSGRRHGMSQELMDLLKWMSIVVGAAAAYGLVGEFIASLSHVFGMLSCYIMGYLIAGLFILGMFILLKRAIGGKLLGSDIFGQSEYYLGMFAGLARHLCILVTVLALLNACAFDPVKVRAFDKMQRDELGNDFFPTMQTVQSMVFERSLVGPLIKDNLGFLLIKRTEPDKKNFQLRDFSMPN